jgi:hypothetical protein
MNDTLLSKWNEVTVAYSQGANLTLALGDRGKPQNISG